MRQRRSRFVPALLLAAVPAVGLAPRAAAQESDDQLAVGRLWLDPCPDLDGAWCGKLRVPFDRADPAAGTIPVNFEWYPASQAPVGTILAMEGGPGYPSTGSRDYYLELYGGLQRSRNLLLVDNRGTGGSGLINCRPLQRWHLALGDAEYDRRVAACGEQLNTARPLAYGGFVHGSDLYGTANAARDLADVLAALETGPVDLYGDSYGSYFGQTFAARYPRLLRSLTLDATWPVLGTDPFYVSTIETARVAFDLACRRSVACALAAPGSSMARIGALAERLRRAPVVGQTREPGSAPSTWRVDVGVLIALVNNAGSDAGVYRELDAAARAVLEHRDKAPLLRLAGQPLYTHHGGRGRGGGGRPVQRPLLHRLPAGVRHAGVAGRPPGPVPGRSRGPLRRHLRAVLGPGVDDLAGGRVRRLPPPAGPGPRRPAHHPIHRGTPLGFPGPLR